MRTVSATQARAKLPELLDRVAEGEEIMIERHGKQAAVLLAPQRLRSRRIDHIYAEAEQIRVELEATPAPDLPTEVGLTEQQAEELLSEVRASRQD